MSKATDAFCPSNNNQIRLVNDGRLQIIFLGTGSAFAPHGFQSNIFIIKGQTHVLIDLGSKASIALHKAGLAVTDIHHLLTTHSHADHIGGIEELCLRTRYAQPVERRGMDKPTLLTTSDYAPILWECSLRGGLEHSEENQPGKRLNLSDYMNLSFGEFVSGYNRPAYRLTVGEGRDQINLLMMRTNHIPDSSYSWQTAFYSIGVVVDDRVFISGDTMFDRELIDQFAATAEVTFHDCQDYTGGVHASYDELKKLPKKLKQKMFLYHLPDRIYDLFEPTDDGFAGWALPFTKGSYFFD